MTVLELNALPYFAVNIQRLLNRLEGSCIPEFFVQVDERIESPIKHVFQTELKTLMPEYRRRMDYIAKIPDEWMRRVFEKRFIERKSFREIGIEGSIAGGTMKQEVYSYVKANPEGYVSCRDLAETWGLNINTINAWCRHGRLPGAVKRRGVGSGGYQRWMIPADVKRPAT